MVIRVSETEVEDIRRVGDLAFTVGNEIITVGVAHNQTLVPGDVVTIGSTGLASKIGEVIINTDDGYGVVIHDSITTPAAAADLTGDELIQIAVGNTYIALQAEGVIAPLARVTTSTTSDKGGFMEQIVEPVTPDGANVLSHVQSYFGRYFGHPGEVIKPTVSAADDIIIVRLGAD